MKEKAATCRKGHDLTKPRAFRVEIVYRVDESGNRRSLEVRRCVACQNPRMRLYMKDYKKRRLK